MRISGASLREIRLRLRERFEISSGWRHDRRILLLTLFGDGQEGWGECVAGEEPNYSYETTETAWYILTEYLLPAVVGNEFADPSEVMARVNVRGHPMAKACIDMAAWDLAARLNDVSLSEQLGGMRAAIPVGVSVGLQQSDEALQGQVAAFLEQGYARIKIKIKPGRDVEMVGRLRDAFPDASLMVDANAAYSLADVDRLKALDAFDLMMIEQPLAEGDLLEHAQLQAQLDTSVCLDESIVSADSARLALELHACRIVNIKPGRVGGFTEARQIHDVLRAGGIDAWCGGMLESGIGRAGNVALASLPGFTLPGDISASRRYWDRDIVMPEFELHDGQMQVPTDPGLGVALDLERIDNLSVRSIAFGDAPASLDHQP